MGDEALKRSFNSDRTRDPLYNQSKMYSEVYKLLGWIAPLPDSALSFQFTYLGAHLMNAENDPAAFFQECVLGIAYPNGVIGVSGNYVMRPFASILKTFEHMDDYLCRDEMIIGPLCLADDTSTASFSQMVAELKEVRGNWPKLMQRRSQIATERNIATTTMVNYTRFPLAVIKWLGWANSERRKDVYGKPTPFLVLTDRGREVISQLSALRDIRRSNLQNVSLPTKNAVARIGFYQMLERAGFDIQPVTKQIESDIELASVQIGGALDNILFSPFQELNPSELEDLFPRLAGQKEIAVSLPSADRQNIEGSEPVALVTLTNNSNERKPQTDTFVATLLHDAASAVGDNLAAIVEHIALLYLGSNKEEFYPLVAALFRSLGYDCQHSRHGVNYQRWDAMIHNPPYSIPIEIKSPGEEEFLSVKAVRQALENKIILLSRSPSQTNYETSSFVVGYNLPNDRSEVASLVADIKYAFGISIGVIDIRSLLHMVGAELLLGRQHNRMELRNLYGIVNVTGT